MKWVLRIGLVMLVVALAAGGFWLLRGRSAATAAATASSSFTQVVDVTRGNLSAAITVVGELDAAQRADLAFERMRNTAKLVTLDVKPGNTVKAGQVLATIDPASYQQALDQANSDLQTALQNLADLKTPATALDIAKADETVAQADHGLQQAKQDLSDLQSPDLSTLKEAIQNAQDDLTLAQLQQTLAEHAAVTKSERDLQYTLGWHERRIADLQALVARHKANLEQTNQLTTEQETLGEVQADLARIQAERQLSLQVCDGEHHESPGCVGGGAESAGRWPGGWRQTGAREGETGREGRGVYAGGGQRCTDEAGRGRRCGEAGGGASRCGQEAAGGGGCGNGAGRDQADGALRRDRAEHERRGRRCHRLEYNDSDGGEPEQACKCWRRWTRRRSGA